MEAREWLIAAVLERCGCGDCKSCTQNMSLAELRVKLRAEEARERKIARKRRPGEVGSTSSGWHGIHDWTKVCCCFQASLHYAGEAAGFCRAIKFDVLPSASWVMTHMRGLSCYIGTHSKQQWCKLVAHNDPDRLGPAMSMPPVPTRPPPRPPAQLELYNADGAEIVY